MAKHKATRNRKGMLPYESRRRSLVTIQEALLDKEPRHYIVETHRLDGAWSHRVTYQGAIWDVPGRVVERLVSQRASIIKEERSLRARERIMAQAERIVEAQG